MPLLLIVIIGAGCSSAKKEAPPPLQPPAVSSSVFYHFGPPIALPTTQPAGSILATDTLAVRTEWLALSRVPQALRPIVSDATLIAAPRAADPLLAAGKLSRDARIISAAEVETFLADVERGKFGQRAAIATGSAALPRGVTATFALGDAGQRIELDLHRPMTATGAATVPSDAIQVSLAIDGPDAQRERVLLDPKPMPPPARFALVLPSHFSSSRVKAIVAIVELAPPSESPEHRQALAECAAQLQRLASGSAQSPAAATGPAAACWPGLMTALRAMSEPTSSRVAMVYLAGETGAELLSDTALVAPDLVLAELSTRIQKRLGDAPNAMEPAELGWVLDVATIEELAALQSSEKMPRELAGVLARYAGEAARNAGSLDELARVRGRDQLRSRLIADNFTYLEDASPSARVRAYDWLKSRGRAPAKYDPLAPPRERAAALDAAITAAHTTTTTGGAP